ncbi:ABC-type transporter permease protein [Melioribacter roseus P3M-2]|uniref:ABC-type transporter permease protein n=1 Tax=Melioribacter roseus (strain DSM 23840 / JCM 17771 / VKM B-2668 / P3M-2) TaxID=1191523 RepID=I6ZQ09_MELRP|nr:ABC transporter permease [Melioribacter roseus]AFN74154.1 ABC-type transporter permease protein [Melioribacter roseus P3M-2]
MFNYRVLAIIKRELRERLFSKAFITTTLLIPGLIIVIFGVQALLYSAESKNLNFELITENEELTSAFMTEFSNADFVKEKHYVFLYKTMTRDEFKKHLEEIRSKIVDESLTGVIYVPSTALKNKKIEYYSKSPQNIALSRELNGPVNKVLVDAYFMNKTLDPEELEFARRGVDFTGFKVSEEEQIKEEGYGNIVLAYAFTFLLYMSLLIIGQITLQSVIEEKSNKIVEIVLSSVEPKELMTGKILGASITGLVQMGIWLFTIMGVVSSSWMTLPADLVLEIDTNVVLYVLVNFFIGLVLFIGLFATVGAIFDNPQDASSGTLPIMMLIIIPFFIAFSIMENPNKPYAEIASLFPFSSVIVMPARMTLIDVPTWQLIAAILINILTIIAIFPVAGKIYRVGILITGKKPKWSEVFRWLRQ